MEIASIIGLACFIAACFLAALTGALFRPGDWYERLKKPSWRPPNRLFAPVWTALYLMIAVAGWLIWRKAGFAGAGLPLAVYALQLILNAAWSPLFFGLHRPDLGFIDIVLVWVSIIATIVLFYPIHVVAALLLVPYLCVGYVRHRAEFRRVAAEFGGVAASITVRRRYRATATSPTARPSPEPGARRSLERAGDIRRDPPSIEFSGLRRHALVIDKAAVKRPRVKGHVIAQGFEGRVRIGIAPGHIAQRFAVHEDIEVDRFALPFAECAPARRL